MRRSEAFSLALGVPSKTAASPHPADGVLGKREAEVARLVAED